MAANGTVKWTRLATMGLAMAGLGPLLMIAAGLAFGLDLSEDVVFLGGTAVIGLLSAALVARFGTWAKIVGIVAGLMLALALFWTAFGLMQPASFFDFVPGLLVLPGAFLGIGACIAAIVAGRRGASAARAEGSERGVIRTVLGVVLLGALVSGALNLFTRPTATPGDAQATATLKDFSFDEEQYQVAGGTEIFVENADPFAHTFTIDELDVDENFVGGSSKRISIPSEPGTYVVYCRPHTSSPEDPEEEDMAATITVT